MENKIYDYLILGAGWGGVSLGALLAKEGKKVCVVEKNDRPCGYGYFKLGEYEFSPNALYIQGCREGWNVYEFIKELGLEKEITFNSLDEDGYDRLILPNFSFNLPIGIENITHKLSSEFPDEDEKIEKFFEIMVKLDDEMDFFEKAPTIMNVLRRPHKNLCTIRYGWMTLQGLFNHLKMSHNLQNAIMGTTLVTDYAPDKLSVLVASAEYIGYASCHYPAKGIGHMIKTVEKFAKENGVTFVYNTEITAISNTIDNSREIQTTSGTFRANKVISNLDPQITYKLLGKDAPRKYHYEYSPSAFLIFLGLTDRKKIMEAGFGKCNYYLTSTDDIHQAIKSMTDGLYDDFAIYIGTPSLVANEGEMSPTGKMGMQIIINGSFEKFNQMTPAEQEKEKERISNKMIDFISKKFNIDLNELVEEKEIWSPVDFSKKANRPYGNIYGRSFSPKTLIFNQLSQETEFDDIFLCGANATITGILGVINGSLILRDKLLKIESEK